MGKAEKILSVFFLFFLLLLLFSFPFSCGEEKKRKREQTRIDDRILVDSSFFVDQFGFAYPQMVSFISPGDYLDVRAKLSCPSYPRNISVEIFLSSDEVVSTEEDFKAEVTPYSFYCQGELDVLMRVYIPDDVPPAPLFLISVFSSDKTKLVITKRIFVQRKENVYDLLSRRWKELPYMNLGNIRFVSSPYYNVEEGKMEFFAVSDDGKLYSFDFIVSNLPDFLKEARGYEQEATDYARETTLGEEGSEPITTVQLWSLPEVLTTYVPERGSYEEAYLSKLGSETFLFLKSSRAIDVFLEGTNGRFLYAGETKPFSLDTTFYYECNFCFVASGSYYFLPPSCDFALRIDRWRMVGDPIIINTIDFPEVCISAYLVGENQRKVVMVGGNAIYVFPSVSTESPELYSTYEIGYETDYVIPGDKQEKIYVIGFPSASTYMKIKEFDLNSFSFSSTFSLPITFQFDFYVPISLQHFIFVSRKDDGRGAELTVVSREGNKTYSGVVDDGRKIYFFRRDEKLFLLFQGGDSIHGFVFEEGEKPEKEFSGYFSGTPVDTILSEKKIFVISDMGSRFIIFEYGSVPSSGNLYFSSVKLERFQYFFFPEDTFFVFFTDDLGCWVERESCEGSEYIFLKSGEFLSEELIFKHTSPVKQKLLGIHFIKLDLPDYSMQVPLVLIQDGNKIRAFVR